jgi:methylglutamate dehydrogenase subunit B
MRITCPYCGERDSREFTYLGDATVTRPQEGSRSQATFEYVYIRSNPAGLHSEHWQHTSGCRAWLIVERDTRTHSIEAVHPAAASDPGATR